MHVSLRTALIWSAFAAITGAQAHVTLDTSQAPALGYVRIAARVPHGCEGEATIGLRVQIPDGVTAVKPQPKPGWTLQVVTEPGRARRAGMIARRRCARCCGGRSRDRPFRTLSMMSSSCACACLMLLARPFGSPLCKSVKGTRSAAGLSALVRVRPTSSSANLRIPFVSCRSPSRRPDAGAKSFLRAACPGTTWRPRECAGPCKPSLKRPDGWGRTGLTAC